MNCINKFNWLTCPVLEQKRPYRNTKKEFEDVAYFEPFYLKQFIATTPKKLF